MDDRCELFSLGVNRRKCGRHLQTRTPICISPGGAKIESPRRASDLGEYRLPWHRNRYAEMRYVIESSVHVEGRMDHCELRG